MIQHNIYYISANQTNISVTNAACSQEIVSVFLLAHLLTSYTILLSEHSCRCPCYFVVIERFCCRTEPYHMYIHASTPHAYACDPWNMTLHQNTRYSCNNENVLRKTALG